MYTDRTSFAYRYVEMWCCASQMELPEQLFSWRACHRASLRRPARFSTQLISVTHVRPNPTHVLRGLMLQGHDRSIFL